MRAKQFMSTSVCILSVLCSLQAQQPVEHVSVCTLRDNAEKLLGAHVEVRALIFAGILEAAPIRDGGCSFEYARGDNYVAFGNRFPVKHDSQWDLMEKLLATSRCADNLRVVRARIRGTVIRKPATGTIPQNEMPPELVIQSVSEVSQVPVKCRPRNGSSPEVFPGTAQVP
jgi:hypothetical protein